MEDLLEHFKVHSLHTDVEVHEHSNLEHKSAEDVRFLRDGDLRSL